MEEEPQAANPESQVEQPAPPKPESRPSRSHRSFLPEVTDVNFSFSRRGYDRAEVDRYVERISRIVVELEASRSPDAVIERALADVGEETSAILRRARHAAEEIIAQAQSDATQSGAQAEADARRTRETADRYNEKVRGEAEEVLRDARQQGQEVSSQAAADAERTRDEADRYQQKVLAHTEQLAKERHRLIEDLRKLADHFHHTADRSLEKVPEPPAGAAEADESLQARQRSR